MALECLKEQQRRVQAAWDEERVFEVDAPAQLNAANKYLGTFPFPYTNGAMHLGHAFTLTKVDFQCHYQRLCGKNVLFPFAFHGTGMPITAAAKRLQEEIAQYGNPPVFPEDMDGCVVGIHAALAMCRDNTRAVFNARESKTSVSGTVKPISTPPAKRSAKVAAKAEVGVVRQWSILAKMGIAATDIPQFVDPRHWLTYFPELAKTHLRSLGIGVDWRRSFMTTDLNPHFDSFVRWQFETLRAADTITFGQRLAVFSPITHQVTADHDRSVGEGVDIKVCQLVMFTLQRPYPAVVENLISPYHGREVVIPVVLESERFELLPGITHVWLSPASSYTLFGGMADESQLFLCSDQSMINMKFQGYTGERGVAHVLGSVLGETLVAAHVKAPAVAGVEQATVPLWPWVWSEHLPATGFTPAVPSDVVVDAAACREIEQKPALQTKFGFEATSECLCGRDFLHGAGAARAMLDKFQIQSPKDAVRLKEAQEYMDELTDHADLSDTGATVVDMRRSIRTDLEERGNVRAYGETAAPVVSRAGHVCCVALCDQWLIRYGKPEWQALVRQHIEQRLVTHNPQTTRNLLVTLDWLKEWGISRSMGEGTRVPWDSQYVIESLSDSTVYMAFYAVCHLLQQHTVPADALTTDVWNYVLNRSDKAPESAWARVFAQMRHEFCYWYPVNLRVSGKDLVGNHLVMSLYHHAAIWPDQPEYWPQCIYANGHVMVDTQKMAKALGNFISIDEAVRTYSADVTRLALATAGDGLEDSNFVRGASIEGLSAKLVSEFEFASHVASLPAESLKVVLPRSPDEHFFDVVFEAQMDEHLELCRVAYESMQYRNVVKHAFHGMIAARNQYRSMLQACGSGTDANVTLLHRWVDRMCRMLAPICPHWSQEIWTQHLGQAGFVHRDGRWPTFESHMSPEDARRHLEQMEFLATCVSTLHKSYEDQWQQYKRRVKLDASIKIPPIAPRVTLWISEGWLPWHRQVIQCLRTLLTATPQLGFREVLAHIRTTILDASASKSHADRVNKFARTLFDDVQERGASAALCLPAEDHWQLEEALIKRFHALLARNAPHLNHDAARIEVRIQLHADDSTRGQAGITRASPGQIACSWNFVASE